MINIATSINAANTATAIAAIAPPLKLLPESHGNYKITWWSLHYNKMNNEKICVKLLA